MAPDADLDGVCDARDACPAAPQNDSDSNGTCDDVDLCNALAALVIPPVSAGEALSAAPGSYPASILGTATLSYAWALDGAPNVTLPTVPAGTTQAEQSWSVQVTATFTSRGACSGTASISFHTGKARCASAAITPANATTSQALTCACTDYQDRDNDPEGASTCQFTRDDGTPLTATGCVLAAGAAPRGAVVTCTYTPVDEDGTGYPASSAVTLLNSAPTAAALTVSTPDNQPIRATDSEVPLHCGPVGLTDADQDPLTFSIQWTVDGELALATTGESSSTVTLGQLYAALATPRAPAVTDVVTCAFTATDGAATLALDTSVALANTAPTVVTAAAVNDTGLGGTFRCTAQFTDADGDALSLAYA